MQFFFIESSPYDGLEDEDHFENSTNPYPYIVCYGGRTEPLCRHSAFSDYDAAVDRANELAQFISNKVEVVYDGTDDIETIYVATPLHESSPYDDLEDNDQFEEEPQEQEEFESCYNCGVQYYIFAGETSNDLIRCNNCGATICKRCLPGGDLFSEKDKEEYEFYPETVGTYELEHCPFCSDNINESSPYDDLEDDDQFSDKEEWDLAHLLEFDGYGPVILLYQSLLRPGIYDICVDINTRFVDWNDISDDMVKDFAIMLSIRNLNQPNLRKETLQVIWDYMLEHKKAWRVPITDSPHLIGLN